MPAPPRARSPCRETRARSPSRLQSPASPAETRVLPARRIFHWIFPRQQTCRRRAAPNVRTSQPRCAIPAIRRSEEHTSELQSHHDLVCRLLLEKKKKKNKKK